MREAGIMLISSVLTCAVIGNAYYQRKQFYPTVVHITKSNSSMTVIYAQGLILVFMINAFLRKIFFGTLRAAELEHLLEKIWYAVTETCLAFTVFRDDFSPKFVALFTLLLFLKSFHWLAEDRVDYMERSPVITWLFHLRVANLLGLLFAINVTMIHYAYNTTATKGPSVQLVFGFEYAILLTVVFNITVKYILHTIDLQSENPWDNKPVFLLYTELIIGLLKVILYVAFVTLMIKLYTLPLFALRPMYYTMRDFKKAFYDIVMSRRAIRNMNTLYPDATAEELAAADNVCIICREEMVAASKKLPCNHIFHTACLRSWFQRQQTCPTCRLNILRPVTNNQETRQQNQPQAGPQAHQAPRARRFNPIVRVLPALWAGLQAPGAAPQQQAPGAPPQQQAPGAAPQQQAPGATPQQQDQNNAGNTPSTSFQNLAAGGVPLFPPPFPTMVPLPPIPTPPPNLTELSEEELRAMEGNLRQAVEARIQTLQRVQLLLDAARAMMNHYQTAAATANIPVPTATSNINVASDVSSMTQPGTSKETCSGVENEHPQAQAEMNVPTINTSSESTNNLSGTNSNDIAPESSIRNEVDSSSEQEMLRRRRLQKFSTLLTTE
ncbi:E3 ubiquitin-protein ligase synoviolin A isoform X1 [Colletes gigas]|uniref:E3 ubiquitin-protein ligase synoviolin A isoform X1 n=1 Tax=Colletes gigas TaxID=935657 RepID=UPI001C9BBCC5|nr:E3 ubiquitin-protein ligase synoviolin A isoform X1 [Colletes gigas]XP_043255771.1 E3 ubiquitin-protein ligase synoviolin A isoform X1 [Colletes gigas]XP_043255772.1 E3 ubiquitin-protein ligase synoviolin A isoform X1 [Colletes gigas]XP_043255773.1 E3 ubiquitin-protein ligase synoviolin A isoform X1 [Colletes gigas]